MKRKGNSGMTSGTTVTVDGAVKGLEALDADLSSRGFMTTVMEVGDLRAYAWSAGRRRSFRRTCTPRQRMTGHCGSGGHGLNGSPRLAMSG